MCPSQIGYLRERPPCVQNRLWQAVVVAVVGGGGGVVAVVAVAVVVVDVGCLWKQTTEMKKMMTLMVYQY